MVPYGKYHSVVTAELVGSLERVWALVIRFYDLAFVSYKVTVMMNPYHGFLQNAIKGNKQEQNQIISSLLIGDSLK